MFGKSLKWVLLASLMVNAALVGFTVAQFTHHGPPLMAFSHMPPHPPEISDKERSILDAAFATERPSFEKSIDDMVAARDKSVAIIRTNPLDLAALDKALAEIRAANAEAQESFHRVMRAAAQQLDPAGREVLSDILRYAPPGNMAGPFGPLGPPREAPWLHEPQRPVFMPGEHPDGLQPPPPPS